MASNFASNYYAERLLELLCSIETRCNLIAPLKVEVQALRLKLSFLSAILSETGKWHVEDRNLKALLTRVQFVCSHEYMDLARLWSDFVRVRGQGIFPMTMDGLLSTMLERIELLRPDIQEIYTTLSKSPRSVAEMTNESLMEHLNSCLQNMVDLLGCKNDSVVPVIEELEVVQKGLRFLMNFLGFAASRCSKLGKMKDLHIHAEIVADNIACLLYLCCVNDKMDDQMVSWMKLELLSQIHWIKPEHPEVRKIYVNTLKSLNLAACTSTTAEFILGFLDSLRENLLELSENNRGFSISVEEQLLALLELLRFLQCLVVDSPSEQHADHDQNLKDLREHNNIMINEAAYVIYSLYDDESDDMASERNSLVSDLLAKFEIAKEEARQLYDKLAPKSLRSNFPSTNVEGFINSLLGNLKLLLSSKADSIAPLKLQIEAVLEGLLSLREDFRKAKTEPHEQEELVDQWTRFKDVAYQTEYIIDSFLARDGAIWFHKLGLFDVIEEIKMIRTGLKHTRSMMTLGSTMSEGISGFPSQISQQTSPNDEFEVFGEESQRIKEQLTNGSKKLQILSIVGMPGIGKTTLANSIFNHSSITYNFHVRAHCCLGQAYDSERLLLEVLQVVTGQNFEYGDEDLDHKLYQSLKGRRYLILLDDIWDLELFGNMRLSFPDDGNGSRILLTSRFDNIASQAGAESVAYHLSPLSDDKSWELLQFKLFGKESCPQVLVEVGKEISISCKGLPLTIDLIAGILRAIVRRKECWQELAQRSWLTEIVGDEKERCRKVVELSYHYLPHYLRPCFLYFGAFPEDSNIFTRRLEWLWIAEGFVQLPENDERSLEDVAQSYTDQLISRNLIMVSRRGSLGRVKASRIHDVLRDFAIAKAKEERFLLPIDGLSNFSTLSSDDYPCFEQYRLCISIEYTEEFTLSNPSGPRVRSVVFSSGYRVGLFLADDDIPTDCPINFSNFRLLRVFDFPDIPIKHISPSIFHLIHLRFLAIKCCEPFILSAILCHLQNLETLQIKYGILGSKTLSPTDIKNMAKLRFLRHFDIFCFALPCISKEVIQKPFGFVNLQSLSSPLLCLGEDHHEKFMKPMPKLRKLRCYMEGSTESDPPPKLDFLENLESLKIHRKIIPVTFGPVEKNILAHTTIMPSFPPYLKKLTLTHLYLPWTNISAPGKLEHLEVLKLRLLKSSTDTWDMVEFGKQFPKLKFLQLLSLDIREWNASIDDFPCLERLHVIRCEGLEELPSCLADIPTLQEINLLRCRNSAAISAEKIKEAQEEMGNVQLVVEINEIVDEDPSRIRKRYYEEGLSVVNDSGQDLPYELITLSGMLSEMKRDVHLLEKKKKRRQNEDRS